MTRIKFFGAAAVLSVLIVSPASAEHMIDEPGMYAFYHPNGDLGIGALRPPAEALEMAPRLVMRHALPMHHRMNLQK